MKPKADFDTTYCISNSCEKKCWRHISNFEFEENKAYWYVTDCMLERFEKKADING